ncbi:MAG TPA: hypothetical protein PLD54_03030 [Candidatus Levybacteria bacterium]|nr:hypothetical protein [Candidatus Levybacteria bacterium]
MYSVYLHDKQFDRDRRALHLDASKSIEDAHKRSKEIIESAVERAKDTLLKTEYIREDIIKDLENNLKEVSEATIGMVRNEALGFNKEYRTMLESIQVEHAKMLEEARTALKDIEYLKKDLHVGLQSQIQAVLDAAQKNLTEETSSFDEEYVTLLESTKKEYLTRAQETLQTLEKIPEQELAEFRTILRTETLSAQKLLGNRIDELFTTAEKEIDREIEGITGTVVEEVLGKKLTKADQETLVMRSLEKAKVEGMFPSKTANMDHSGNSEQPALKEEQTDVSVDTSKKPELKSEK